MQKGKIKSKLIESIIQPGKQAEQKKLYIFFGLPGSGKSTLAKRIYQENKDHCVYLSTDKISLSYELDQSDNYHWTFEIFDDLISYYLRAGYSVVADTNADKYSIRNNYFQIADAEGAELKSYFLKSNLAEIKKRQKKRDEIPQNELRAANLYNHSQENIDSYLDQLEAPRKKEKVYLIDGNFDLSEQLKYWELVENKNLFKYLEQIRESLAKKADPEKAEGMANYMREQFPFYGLQAAERRKALRKFMRQENRPDYNNLEIVIKKLWQLPEREFQYFAQELLVKYQKEYREDIIELFEYLILNKSWWDSVDHIAKKLVGEYFKIYPQKRDGKIKEWLQSGNIWLQRTALLFQLGYQEKTDAQLLYDLIEELKNVDEFFIQKAIGWALREYSKTEPIAVVKFINSHQLSALAEREGLKVVKRNS